MHLRLTPWVWVAVTLATSVGIQQYWDKRDAQTYLGPPPAIDFPGRVRGGYVVVEHEDATLDAAIDDRQTGPLPRGPVRIAYQTSFDPATCSSRRHILMIHGTAVYGDVYHATPSRMRAAGYDEEEIAALATSLSIKSVADRLHDAGLCVTTVDLRGHGRSEVTEGPYTVQLLAADIAAAVRLIHGEDVRLHVNGLSIGFATAMAMALDYPEMVITVSGSGFLADMRPLAGGAAEFFSSPLVIRTLGMGTLGWGAEMKLQCDPKGFLPSLFRRVHTDGYARTSAGWLGFNVAARLPELGAPALVLHPAKDMEERFLETIRAEVDQVPVAEMVVFNETGREDHCMPMYLPDRYFSPVADFIARHS